MLRLLFILCCWIGSQQGLVDATLQNSTIDDTDSSIVYSPADAWHLNSSNCTSCLNPSPSAAYPNSYHEGTHPAPALNDGDDSTSSASAPIATPAPPPTPPPPQSLAVEPSPSTQPPASTTAAAQPDTDGGNTDTDGDGGNDGDEKKKGSNKGRSLKRRFFVRVDADDPNFVDVPVTVTFNFTGMLPDFFLRHAGTEF